jgi:hypothetical protein
MAKSPAEARRRAGVELAALREYAALLGEERGVEETRAMEAEFAQLQAAPAMAKMAVSRAFAQQRSARKFGKDEDSAS